MNNLLLKSQCATAGFSPAQASERFAKSILRLCEHHPSMATANATSQHRHQGLFDFARIIPTRIRRRNQYILQFCIPINIILTTF